MAKKETQAANTAGETRREKEKKARRKNADKQKRFREIRKSEGYKRITLWHLPGPGDKRLYDQGFRQVPAWEIPQKNANKSRAVKVKVAVQIRETSLHAAAKYPQVQKAVAKATSVFLHELGNLPEGKAVYNDFLELVALIGDP